MRRTTGFNHVHRDRNIDCLQVTEDTRIPLVNNLGNPTAGLLVFLRSGNSGSFYYADGLKWNLLNPGLSTTSFVSGASATNTGTPVTNLPLQAPTAGRGSDLLVGSNFINVEGVGSQPITIRISYSYKVLITAQNTANIAYSTRPITLFAGADPLDTHTISVYTNPAVPALNTNASNQLSFSGIFTVEPNTQIRWALPASTTSNLASEQYFLSNYTVEILK